MRRKRSCLDLAHMVVWTGVNGQLPCPGCTDQLVTPGKSCVLAHGPGCE